MLNTREVFARMISEKWNYAQTHEGLLLPFKQLGKATKQKLDRNVYVCEAWKQCWFIEVFVGGVDAYTCYSRDKV